MFKKLIVAIDGPAGSGKSTSAKLVAQRLNFLYIDTGAMYRAVTLLAIRTNILSNPDAIINIAEKADIKLDFIDGKTIVHINGEDVTEAIRTSNVNLNVSNVSKISGVRNALVKKQRLMALKNSGIVMEGRDIATVVFPDADVKIYLTASIEQRTLRRTKELVEKGTNVTIEEIKENLENRDIIDSTRSVSPLVKTPDAIEIDTSNVSIDDQVNLILEKVKQVAKQKGIKIDF